jgi:hypothetical protein
VDAFFASRAAEGETAEQETEPAADYPEGAALVCD